MSFLLHPFDDEIRHFHIACGVGSGAKGMSKARPRVGMVRGRMACIGGVDVDPACIRDFSRRLGTPGTVMDLFRRDDYTAFHGKEPPKGWREATAVDLRIAAGRKAPNIVFSSTPCKGASGLLPEAMAVTPKYQALNRLAEHSIELTLEAWADDLPEFILFENVPRIQVRGRAMIDRIIERLEARNYACAETVHDCGELGNLAQSRKRFLLVARQRDKIPPFLYEPPMRGLRTVGDVLEKLPPPGDMSMGLGHRVPALTWMTWVRLAFVEAGSDWRSLNKLAVEDGVLRDYRLVPEGHWRDGILGVNRLTDSSGAVIGSASALTGAFSVADPITPTLHGGALGVRPWDGQSGTVQGRSWPFNGNFAIGDIRPGLAKFSNVFRVVPTNRESPTISGGATPSAGGLCVADPHYLAKGSYQQFGVRPWDGQSGTITGQKSPGQGAFSIAAPMPGHALRSCAYGVNAWGDSTGTIAGETWPTNGNFSVGDPRCDWHPAAHRNKLKVVGTGGAAPTISCSVQPASGGLCVADPKAHTAHKGAGKYAVVAWGKGAAGTVIAASTTGHGAFAAADPRPHYLRDGREAYITAGMYGVLPMTGYAGAVNAHAKHDNGAWSVADGRDAQGNAPIGRLPDPKERLVCVIRALDGTWHRPFTTLELAALQSMVEPGEPFELDGTSDSRWREAIGNAVPEDAAEAIGNVFGQLILLVRSGRQQPIRHTPIWVRPVAIGATLDVPPLLI
ncbi:DNA cytosine methyltransferase [Nitrospirillum sp. BR 11163]|uniref:DNA cytosine methyltransferase n=1 Tax=Nitrospirillum sp. BR 11163 TaxID=3104323 RepID=UPI002AFEA7A8|nr:DNA cytosine methyltransferase [Nitrospirillum sp. BR 11163]MEA1674069.1 DNA cytosine methyltransferase [Nitrospirillum sp. BR 11163]